MFFATTIPILMLLSKAASAPLVAERANPCFVVGSVALPAEVADELPGLAGVTCDTSSFAFQTVPDVTSGGISYSSIDFTKSSSDPLTFALATFTTPADPAQGSIATLQTQLNDYLAVEAGVRSLGGSAASSFLGKLKCPKFFIQFQQARINQAHGVALSAADTVEHQLGKTQKNCAGDSASALAQLAALANVV